MSTQHDDHLHSTGIHHMYLKRNTDSRSETFILASHTPSSSSSPSSPQQSAVQIQYRGSGQSELFDSSSYTGGGKVHHKPVTCCRGLARGAAYPPQQERSGAHRNDRHMTDLSARAARAQTHSRTRSNACFPTARNFRAKRSNGRAQPA